MQIGVHKEKKRELGPGGDQKGAEKVGKLTRKKRPDKGKLNQFSS
jgi:hypothetical protein